MSLQTLLANTRCQRKILGFSASLALLIVIVAAVGAYNIYSLSRSVVTVQSKSQTNVDEEVRHLATRANTATDDISTLIERISSSVERTVQMLEASVKM